MSCQKTSQRCPVTGPADLDLVRRHNKGVAPQLGYFAWRLTGRGVGVVLDQFPNESIPEGLDERLAAQSVTDIEHREAITRVYLDLIRGNPAERADEPTWQELQVWLASVRHRADQFTWMPDGSVVLQFRFLGEPQRLVPDATVTSEPKALRLFIELDRSNKPLSRIRENLQRYERFCSGAYRAAHADKKTPWVVYVVRSTARKAHVERLARTEIGRSCETTVLTFGNEATQWLAKILIDEEREDLQRGGETARRAPPEVVFQASSELLQSTRDLLKAAPGEFEAIGRAHPQLVIGWKRNLRRIYHLLTDGVDRVE
jgi:hypothetical protein